MFCVHTVSMAGCSQPNLDEAGLEANGTRHRHSCAVLHRACLFNSTIVPYGASEAEERHARAVADRLMIRNIFNSHSTPFPLRDLHRLGGVRQGSGSLADRILDAEVKARGFSPCVPLVWRPVWAFNFGEQFANTISPLHELHAAKLVDSHVLLRPDLAAAKRPGWYQQLFGAFSEQPLTSLREVGTRCLARDAQAKLRGDQLSGRPAQRCSAACYERLLICSFQSLLDTNQQVPAGFAPWRAAQYVAAHVMRGTAEPPSPVWRVLFVNRTQTLNKDRRGLRRISNLAQLLEQCAGWTGVGVRCSAREFGKQGVASDIRAVREADVLVGTHGSALDNALFMRRGSAMIEVRPYGFEGQWPDRYLKLLTAIENAVHYYQISTGAPQLSSPRPPYDVLAWDAWNRDTKVPWRTLSGVLRTIFWVNRSTSRLKRLPMRVWTSLPSAPAG